MAKKKKRRRPSGQRPAPASATAPSEAGPQPQARPAAPPRRAPERRERKEEARQARQAALRRMHRQRLIRRAVIWGVGLVVVIGAYWLITKPPSYDYNKALAARADTVAAAAGCTGIQSPPDQGREHIASGGSFTYDQQPPTSGSHDPSPLSAGAYDTPQQETRLVHSLEHGAVEIYYQASGADALAEPVLNALRGLVRGKVILTPAPQAMSPPLDGKDFSVSLAFAGWDRLRQCPGSISSDDATLIARSFIDRYVDAPNAPERGRPI
ncbi:MAG: DUF3105 domain-containing protein [Actinomycetota bacterium]